MPDTACPLPPVRSLSLALPLIVLPLIALTGCTSDETLTAYGAADQTWVLTLMDGAPVDAATTLSFPAPGQIAGQAPCNAYRAQVTAPYPWFDVTSLSATRAVCPQLLEETDYLEALQAMEEAEVLGNTLILRNDTGRELVFKAGVTAGG